MRSSQWFQSIASALFATAAMTASHADETEGLATATFAGGCFWCVEEAFEKLDGVVDVISGYTGGRVAEPSYQQVSAGSTGHTEAVEVSYDPATVSYEELLSVFWRNIDPTTPNRQFCDIGSQYRAGIFYHDDQQQRLAQASLREVETSKPFDAPIVTEITSASQFYAAEEYHQDYYKKNPVRYNFYKWSCGRAQRLEELWG